MKRLFKKKKFQEHWPYSQNELIVVGEFADWVMCHSCVYLKCTIAHFPIREQYLVSMCVCG